MPENQPKLPFDQGLLDLLVCPEAHVPAKFVAGKLVSTDSGTRRAYRVDDGIPVMLIEESQVLDAAAWKELMAQPGPVGGGVAAVRARSSQPGSVLRRP